MKRIILHWTAGEYYPTAAEREYYHFLVGGDGKIYKGKFRPEDNLVCVKGCYAAHTGGGNTGSIGISLCAMEGFRDKEHFGKYPITPVQFEAAMQLSAKLVLKYGIKTDKSGVMTHYEFGLRHPDTTSYGKPDITFIPPYPWVGKNEAGDFIRSKIRWYKAKMKEV